MTIVAANASPTPTRMGRLNWVAFAASRYPMQGGEEEHRLEAFAEDDDERLRRDQRRRGETGIGELALGGVDQRAQVDDLVPDGLGRRATGDRVADLGELLLGGERQLGSASRSGISTYSK